MLDLAHRLPPACASHTKNLKRNRNKTMKTRTSQNGVAGIMSRLILNIKSAALALAALGAAQIATAATTQSFLFYGQSGTSQWGDKNSWKYNNGSASGTWNTPTGSPDTFSYDVYFRSGMAAPNNKKTQSYNSSWNHVVTFSGAQKVGATQQPLHLDAGSSAANPIVFTATQSGYGLTSSSTLNIAETANGYMTIQSGTYKFGYIILGCASGKTGVLTMNGGTLKILNNYTRLGDGGSTGILTVKTGAVFDNSEATGNGKNMTLGQSSGSTGTLNVQGGDVTVAGYLGVNYHASSKNSAINITDGGVLTVGNMAFGGTIANTITISDGTIKAHNDHANFIPSHSLLTFTVGAGGGTIDSDTHNVTIGAAIGGTGGMTFKGGGTITLTGANTYTGGTVIDAGTTIQMPAANNLTGNIVVTNATLANCSTVLTLTGEGADASTIFSRCSLAADADTDNVELTIDGASVKLTAKAGQPTTARLIYDSGTDSWNWEFRDITDAVIPSVDQSALEAGSITVIFGSTAELAAIGTTPAWVGGWQMASTFTFDPSASASLPAEYTFDAGTVIDLKGCDWTLPDQWKSATEAFTVTNSVDATKAVLTVDVASGTFTETYLTLGGNLELRKTGAGTYAMTKNQAHTGGTVVTTGAMTSSANRTVAAAANSTGSMTIDGGTFTTAYDVIVGGGENSTGSLTVTNGTFTMTGSSRYLALGNASGATGTVNLDGGELVMSARGFTTHDNGSGEVVFNGGTLTYAGANEKPIFQKNLTVKVGAGGGTMVFAAGKYPTNNLSIVSGVAAGETDGGMTFKGGGKFTELGSLSYTGGTTVEIGTTLVVPDTSLGGGLSAAIPETQPAVGTTNILVTTTGEGVFTDSDLPDVTAFPYYRAMLSADAKSILVVRVPPAMSVTGFNLETGEITLGFADMDGALDLVVAWDTSDHGATLTSWPSGKSIILGTVAAGTTTATFTLPDEVQTVGTYYRLFLGDSATKPYDEEVAWIQPTALGAYITTSFKPSANPKAEFKMNMDGQTYSSWARVFRSAAGWPNNLQLSVNSSGQIQNTRVGVIEFNAVNKTADHVITLSYQYSDRSTAIKIDGTAATPSSGVWNNYNQNNTVTPQQPITLWADADGANLSAVKLYYMKWMNTSGTVQANFIPVKKDGEYCLYDKVNKTLATNSGAEGTSFKGGAKTAYGPVTFADGQMGASDTQQYLGATLIDQENCSIAMDGATATINWALTQPGGPSAEIVAVFTTGSTAVTNVLATARSPSSREAATTSR